MASKYSATVREKVFRLRAEGRSQREVSAQTGVHRETISEWERQARIGRHRDKNAPAHDIQGTLPIPKTKRMLKPEPRKALDDFAYWRYRYFARRSIPWQEEAAYQIVGWLQSDQTEYIVMNCPPGAGKTTLWTDLMAWLICRDREIRILFGSSTTALASQPVNRVRHMLERPRPVQDAHHCLSVDYGRFKPEMQDIWRRNEFTVMAMNEQPMEDKEATLTAYGMDSIFLGHRGDLVLWDDLVVGKTLRNIEAVENQRKWWEEEGSTRVEPGGALVLNGQRMGPADLYRYSLDQKLEETEESRWRHVVYPAYFDDDCGGDEMHKSDSPAWPMGCLLDPIRLPWHGTSGLVTIRRNRAEKYRVQYQQEETDPTSVLVQPVWVSGGRDRDTGEEFPGCWDMHRGLGDVPVGLSAPVYSIATADPSPSKYWGIEWWLYHPASEQRFLMDLIREPMEAGEFLDWNENSKAFFGVMEDWQTRSRDLNFPITHWVVEINAAQKFLLAYDHVDRWIRKNKTQLIAHSTTRNKLDPEFGVQTIANRYRFGNVRLPGREKGADGFTDAGKVAALMLVREATTYPDGPTDDLLMAQWFLEYNLPRIAHTPAPKKPAKRPSWMRRNAA